MKNENEKPLKCSNCKEEKESNAFGLANSKRGFQYWCKSCMKNRNAIIAFGKDCKKCESCSEKGRIASNGKCDSCLMAEGLRECRSCKVILLYNMFFYPGHGRCRGCVNLLQSAYSKKNPEKIKAIAKRSRLKDQIRIKNNYLKHKYAISWEDYLEISKKQKGLCAICAGPPDGDRLFVDHSHTTGRVRGLLCRSCNSGIGQLKDSVVLLKKATRYLVEQEALESKTLGSVAAQGPCLKIEEEQDQKNQEVENEQSEEHSQG